MGKRDALNCCLAESDEDIAEMFKQANWFCHDCETLHQTRKEAQGCCGIKKLMPPHIARMWSEHYGQLRLL